MVDLGVEDSAVRSNLKKGVLAVCVALAFVAGVVENFDKILDALKKVYSVIVPSVEISPGVVGSDNDAMRAEFVFLNTGALPLLDNDIECDIHAANIGHFHSGQNFVLAPGRNITQFVPRLDPGKPITRNCGELIGEFTGITALYPATFTISLSSKWPSFWQHFDWKTRATFVGIPDASGHIKIQPDG